MSNSLVEAIGTIKPLTGKSKKTAVKETKSAKSVEVPEATQSSLGLTSAKVTKGKLGEKFTSLLDEAAEEKSEGTLAKLDAALATELKKGLAPAAPVVLDAPHSVWTQISGSSADAPADAPISTLFVYQTTQNTHSAHARGKSLDSKSPEIELDVHVPLESLQSVNDALLDAAQMADKAEFDKAEAQVHPAQVKAIEDRLRAASEAAREKARNANNKKGWLANISTSGETVHWVNPFDIEVEPGFNKRNMESMPVQLHIDELSKSISAIGVKEPLKVHVEGERVILTNGHCRLAAVLRAIKNGAEIAAIPVRLEERGTSAADRILTQVVSNAGLPLTPWENAQVVKGLLDFGWSLNVTAQKTGFTRVRISQLLNMLEMPAPVVAHIASGVLSECLARKTAASISNPKEFEKTVEKAVEVMKAEGKATVKPAHIEVSTPTPTSANPVPAKTPSATPPASSSVSSAPMTAAAGKSMAMSKEEMLAEAEEIAKQEALSKKSNGTGSSNKTGTGGKLQQLKEIFLNASVAFDGAEAEVVIDLEDWYTVCELLDLPEPTPDTSQKFAASSVSSPAAGKIVAVKGKKLSK